MSVLLFFVDGLGLGPDDPATNPVARARLRRLRLLRGQASPDPEARVVPVDACLGVPGLPQSATGQTALLTGRNAPAIVGRHVQGFCTPQLAALLDGASLFSRVAAAGARAAFANAYTPTFLASPPRFVSVTTVAVSQAGMPFRTLDDLRAGAAVYHDFTNRILAERGYALPLVTPAEAGRRLAALTQANDFTMYEFFRSDLAGHARDMDRAVHILEALETMVESLLAALDRSRHLVVLASDHGNLEDLTTGGHTANPVPAVFWGRGAEAAAASVRTLADIAPAILRRLDVLS
jgi:hypothetical protein